MPVLSNGPCTMKKLYPCCYLQFHVKQYLIGKGKKYPFQKIILASGNPKYSTKKNKQGISLHNYFKNLTKNVILPGKMSILHDIWYLSKTARKSLENIERLGIFYKFIFWRCYVMLMMLKLISIIKFNTSCFAVNLQKTLYFLVFHRNIGLKTSKHEVNDRSHQNKQGF